MWVINVPAGNEFARLDALATTSMELQEEDEISAVAELEADWLAAGLQALDPPRTVLLTGGQWPDTSLSYLLFQTLLPLFWTLTCMI